MKVRELLCDESKWIKRAMSRSRSKGILKIMVAGDADGWCLSGALIDCYPDIRERDEIILKIYKAINPRTMVEWNDDPDRTFGDVRSLVEQLDI
jgi:hypothetical protein